MAKPVREVQVGTVLLKLRGKGWGGKISILEPVKGTIEVHRSRGEFLAADWFSEEAGVELPVRPEDVVSALDELDG